MKNILNEKLIDYVHTRCVKFSLFSYLGTDTMC